MNPRVKGVKPNSDYTITVSFTNGERRKFDVKPYLDKGFFRELKDIRAFNTVKPFMGSIQWQSGQDFCPDTLYEEGVSVAGRGGKQKPRTGGHSMRARRSHISVRAASSR